MFSSCDSQNFVNASRSAKYVLPLHGIKINNSGDTLSGGGSSVVVRRNGYIVTNHHVIKELNNIYILYGKDTLYPKILGDNKYLDIVVLKVDKDLPCIKIGNSDKIKIGENILNIGFPLYLNKTVNSGIISSRINAKPYNMQDDIMLIETDAVLNPGNSGGALVDIDGKLIGINSMLVTGTGYYIGYSLAIPINDVMNYVDSIIYINE